MSTLNRKKPPVFHTIDKLDVAEPQKRFLDNGIPVYVIDSCLQDVIEIDFIFEAGSWYQETLLTAFAANSMLVEGSKKYSSTEIAEKIDFYGAYINLETENHTALVSLYTLNKYLDETLEVMEDVIKRPTYPQDKFDLLIQNKKQQYTIEQGKVAKVSRDKFYKVLFGEQHPYGRKAELQDFDNLKPEMLADFHQQFYFAENCKILVAGKVTANLMTILNSFFGGDDWKMKGKNPLDNKQNFEIQPSKDKQHFIPKDDAVQSAIRLGKVTIDKLHPDFIKLDILNTILGGYFGSRLMSNIREEKGYTYGINSVLGSFRDKGYFFIATETGVDVCQAAIEEIRKEIKLLRTELVDEEELELVKNYMIGELIRGVDGAFSLSESYRSLMEHGYDFSYMNQFIKTIQDITSKELMELAQTHLHEDSLYEIIVGKK